MDFAHFPNIIEKQNQNGELPGQFRLKETLEIIQSNLPFKAGTAFVRQAVQSHIQMTSGNLQVWRLQSLLGQTLSVFYHPHVKRFPLSPTGILFVATFICCFLSYFCVPQTNVWVHCLQILSQEKMTNQVSPFLSFLQASSPGITKVPSPC